MAAAWMLALLSGCNPTNGSNPNLFQQAPTTNTDFTELVSIPTGMQPVSVAVAPWGTVSTPVCKGTNNTAPNAAVANFIDNTVTYLKNDGTGNFTTQTIPTGLAPVQIKFADLDYTSLPNCSFDMVVMLAQNPTGLGGGFTVLLTTDNVNWTPQTLSIGATPAQFELIDMNNDGYVDIVASVPAADAMYIYLNNGDGTFNPTALGVPLEGAPARFVVRDYLGAPLDVDHDKCPDIAALIPSVHTIDVAYNVGASCGTAYSYVSFGTDTGPVDINAADLNGTGWPDLLVITASTPRIDVFNNGQTSPPTFGPFLNTPLEIRNSPSRIYMQKFDGTNPEAAIVHTADGTVDTFSSLADATVFEQWNYRLLETPIDLAIGHFTNSGNWDLAVPESTNRILFIGRNDGTGFFVFTQIGFAETPGEPAVAPLRGTGTYYDILLPQKLNNAVLYLKNNNG